jgi:hypothetical protein
MNFWAYNIEDTLVFRPRRPKGITPLIGRLCTVVQRYEGMTVKGERLHAFGGVYDVAFETGEVLCVWEHDLVAPGERRWWN